MCVGKNCFLRKEGDSEEDEEKHICGQTGGEIDGFEGCGVIVDMEDTIMLGNTSFCMDCGERYQEEYYDEEADEETDDEDEFTCAVCNTTQGNNDCVGCERENICVICEGVGGDWGENEDWVCNNCLPTCLGCQKKLYQADEECCGVGRSDAQEDE